MKKFLVGFLLVLLASPWPFLFSSAKKIEGTQKVRNCKISKVQHEFRAAELGITYVSGLAGFFHGQIIVPMLGVEGDVSYADCDGEEILIGILGDWDGYIKPGAKVSISTDVREVRFFGVKVTEERDITSIGSGWIKE